MIYCFCTEYDERDGHILNIGTTQNSHLHLANQLLEIYTSKALIIETDWKKHGRTFDNFVHHIDNRAERHNIIQQFNQIHFTLVEPIGALSFYFVQDIAYINCGSRTICSFIIALFESLSSAYVGDQLAKAFPANEYELWAWHNDKPPFVYC